MNSLSDLIYDSASGISYRASLPTPDAPQRLLVLLHGVGGSEENLTELATAVDKHTLVLLARGPLMLDSAQFAWFHVEFTESGPTINAEEAEDARAKLIVLLRSVQHEFGISSDKTTLAGFSQGGIMSASVALTSPESLSAFGLMSGLILPEITTQLAPQAQLGALRGFVSHGEDDAVLSVDWAVRSNALLDELGVDHEYHLYPADHEVSEAMRDDFAAWHNTMESA